ncbi:MAG: copper-binding protein [Bradyrhizobium sp.]|nr:copper-binding protein [Bradyrhizobium sp.]
MKITTSIILATGPAFLLAACGSNAGKSEPAAAATAKGMAMPDADAASMVGKTVTGVGEVTAVDTAAGKVTLKHQAIAEAHWPAMTMAFTASPKIVAKAKVGEQVSFDLKLGEAGGEVTDLRPR